MEKTANKSVAKFRNLLTGSATARNLSFLYIIFSLMLAYKMKAHIEYVIPLILGALLILWHTLTHMMLKNFDPKRDDLQSQFKLYRAQILKREKYEATVFFLWLVTIVPAYLYGKEISVGTIIACMVMSYVLIVLGGYLFKRAKKEIEDLELQINRIE